jgi:GNAT superfamily N-acetyltransferase
MTISDAAPDSPDACRLLAHYFAWRAKEFPPSGGSYTITWPEPAAFAAPDGAFLLADDGDAVVGCGGIRRISDDSRGVVRFEVKHVWLEPAGRGRGLAGQLMSELESRARSFGAGLVVLDTHHSLTDAARLYARRGYTKVDAYNDNPNATVWYAKELRDASSDT